MLMILALQVFALLLASNVSHQPLGATAPWSDTAHIRRLFDQSYNQYDHQYDVLSIDPLDVINRVYGTDLTHAQLQIVSKSKKSTASYWDTLKMCSFAEMSHGVDGIAFGGQGFLGINSFAASMQFACGDGNTLAHGGVEGTDRRILFADCRAEVRRKSLTILRVVEQAQSALTNENNEVRNRGIMVTVACGPNLTLTRPVSDPQSKSSLIQFYGDRLQDEPCVKEVLRGLKLLIESLDGPLSDDLRRAATHAVVGVLKYVHVQSLALSDRHKAFGLVEEALGRLELPLSEQDVDVLECWVQCMNGERDPRNLLLCFRLIPRIAAKFLTNKDKAEDFFNVFSCYFPITFTPPPDDKVGISADMLREALLECMTCHFLLIPFSLDLALSKLAEAESTGCRLDSLDLLATLATKHGVQGSLGHDGCQQVWSSLRLQIVDSSEQEVQERARSCLRHILRIAAEEVGDERQEATGSSCLHTIMKTLKMQTTVDLKTPQELRSRKGLSTVLCAVSAHPVSAKFVLHDSLYALRDIVLASGGESGFARMYAALQVIHEILLSSRSLWMYMKGRPAAGGKHPLSEVSKDTFDTLTSVFVHDSFAGEESSKLKQTSLQSICELIPVMGGEDDVRRAFDMLVGEFVALCRSQDERLVSIKRLVSSCLAMMEEEDHPAAISTLSGFTALCLNDDALWGHGLEVLRSSFAVSVRVARAALDILLEARRREGVAGRQKLIFQGLLSVIDAVRLRHNGVSPGGGGDDVAVKEECVSIGSLFATKIVPELVADLSCDQLQSSSFAGCFEPLAGMIRATLELVGEGGGSKELVSLLLDKYSTPIAPSGFSCEQLKIIQSVFMSAVHADLRFLDESKRGFVRNLAASLLDGFDFSQEDPGDCRKSIVASVMNKLDGEVFESMYQFIVEQTLLPKVKEEKFAWSANQFLAWIAKALVCRGHPKGQVIVEIFRGYLTESNEAKYGVIGYQVLGSRDLDKDFSKQNHFICKPLWRQRFFSQEFFLMALVHLLHGTPVEAVALEAPRVIPLLVQALNCPAKETKVAALELLFSFIDQDSKPNPGSDSTSFMEGQLSTLIQALLDCSSFSESLIVRCRALDCLSRVPKIASYHKVYPFRTQVTRALGKVLSDHKRCVRLRGANCRSPQSHGRPSLVSVVVTEPGVEMLRLGKDRSISDYLERVKDRRELISRKFGSDGHEVKVEQIRSSMRYREFEMTKLRYQHNVASALRKDDKESRQPSSGRADFSSLRYHRERRISSHHPPSSSSPSRDLPPSTDQIRDRVVGLRNVGHSSSLSLYFSARDSEWKGRNSRFMQYMESKHMLSDRGVHRNTSPDMFLPDSLRDDLVSVRDLSIFPDEFQINKASQAEDYFTTSSRLSEEARSVFNKSPTDFDRSPRHVRDRWPGPLLRFRSKSAEPAPFLGQAARQELYEPFRKTSQTSHDATYGPRAESLAPPIPIKGRRHAGSYKYILTHSQSSAARMKLTHEQGPRLNDLNLAMASECSYSMEDADATDASGVGKIKVAIVKKDEGEENQQLQSAVGRDEEMALERSQSVLGGPPSSPQFLLDSLWHRLCREIVGSPFFTGSGWN
ncbi:hypothetical protein GUITHDRAFT_143405 [Guillardia theta CCMP2712]|uniref:MMS19 nucleotide excision repair protein n=1 Tax=Guillardia theta (strain CCMP2712) TaxID=905079 RepID=L1IUW3_GUITC|nr:hypothetical protein GUITHDRAFT_143405 [Guillardia theta CCMP2712]EKX39630.1 hypothetical protein GUITHDRAFT_143405 [Guillardia theta CCMP2712]|eukprot:XP_005826610.1 hypothetical protein GUITHDRAFT_143405 [Guillardia theta CCMP2712]